MNRQFVKDTLIWGFLLWLFGYILGIVFFMLVPAYLIGWIIMPLGLVAAWLVLVKKIPNNSLAYYLKISLVWTVIAIIFDYLFIVQLLKPQDGYYKLDVYLYYCFTFILPLVVYGKRNKILKV